MSHEIYYTSAPEGLKRGTSGFCTVAASENIPKALWDRLETLSAYRHQFAQGAGVNPVSYAHWILTVTGKTHHVLSRICDSGVDHTQRTNAFAHHLMVDTAEIEAAMGGPAWMLEQFGVMADSWNGQVGPLSRGPLPRGDMSPGICRGGSQATGDAGWGGHLADLFAKTPMKPVCILFSPGQEMLPLIGEAIALPAPPAGTVECGHVQYVLHQRMPTSCQLFVRRCCLGGTPAAAVGLRFMLRVDWILDLTDLLRGWGLTPSDGPYATNMARLGQPGGSTAGCQAMKWRLAAELPAKTKMEPYGPLHLKDADRKMSLISMPQERGRLILHGACADHR